jgi:hypothetical protein
VLPFVYLGCNRNRGGAVDDENVRDGERFTEILTIRSRVDPCGGCGSRQNSIIPLGEECT